MKNLIVYALVILLGFSSTINAQDKKKVKPVDPIGTWDFQSTDAPYGYEKGQFIISKGEKGLNVKIVFTEYSKTDAYKVKYENNKLSFTVYVEDDSVYVTGDFAKDSFKGKASTTMGDIALAGTRKKAGKK